MKQTIIDRLAEFTDDELLAEWGRRMDIALDAMLAEMLAEQRPKLAPPETEQAKTPKDPKNIPEASEGH